MTSDMKIAGKTLTSDTSNVTTSVTLPTALTISNENTPNTYTEAKIGSNGVGGTYLYNWYAATAATSDVQGITTGNAPQDICPRGWHLPNNDGNASWNKLLRVGQDGYQIATSSNGYSSSVVSWTGAKFTVANQNPLSMHLTGLFNSGSLYNTSNGNYWSRTAYSGTNAYYLRLGSGSVNPQHDYGKQYGFAVRCVSEGDPEPIQGWTGCSGLSAGKTVTLSDNRDGKEYTVAKIGSQCWMTKNLALGSDEEITLTSSNSDVSSNFPLPASSTPDFSDTNINVAKVNIDTKKDANGNEYGGYYNWYAATAGTGTSSMGSNQVAGSSICPKGWKLPTKAQFDSLLSAVDTGNFTKSPFNGALAGFYNGSSRHNADIVGVLWSSTAVGSDYTYGLYFNSSNAGTSIYDKFYGLSVRCVSGS